MNRRCRNQLHKKRHNLFQKASIESRQVLNLLWRSRGQTGHKARGSGPVGGSNVLVGLPVLFQFRECCKVYNKGYSPPGASLRSIVPFPVGSKRRDLWCKYVLYGQSKSNCQFWLDRRYGTGTECGLCTRSTEELSAFIITRDELRYSVYHCILPWYFWPPRASIR